MAQQTEQVPTEEQGAPSISGPEHFAFVLVGTLAKACLHYGFHQLAFEFMRHMRSKAVYDPVYRAATKKVIETLLLSGMEKDAEMLAGLVTSWAQDTAAIQPLSDELIWLLYDFCSHVGRPDLVLFVHERLSTPALEEIYPLPQGNALAVLLAHLYRENRYIEGRKVIRNLLQHNYRIDPMYRSDVIYHASRLGLASEARALYEKYEHRAKSSTVLGSAKLATELVAHFMRVVDDQSSTNDKPKADDASAFARKVVSNFVRSKGELAKQTRENINAIAHCYFLIGELDAGFRALRVMLHRKQIPHQNDVNVLLRAAAKYSPRTAVKLLDRALKENYKAGPRAYATLLHYAQKHGDSDLAQEILHLAAKEGEAEHLDFTAKDSMIRAQLQPFMARHGSKEHNAKAYPALRSSLMTMMSLRDHGVEVKDALVHVAIRAALNTHNLYEAYDFWHAFFRGRVPEKKDIWYYCEHELFFRIEEAVKNGVLPFVKGSVMLAQLKSGGFTKGEFTMRDGRRREIIPFGTQRYNGEAAVFSLPSADEEDNTTIPSTEPEEEPDDED
ncbi:hypothetical protein CALVIDRAFT_247624 [Calocera viscosa TUFC12733]|uniref:Pentacotripeptide-repeat region of PRORP domain-containing protein n=1 Tax=Calocera viscosa (strain TUFC12733) TaxID=1330018 RepID=A0A167JLB3_CALVF|nr:hypothetical protein CALVIDRAFT_247624 [Calocera viscosa TUFC12733]